MYHTQLSLLEQLRCDDDASWREADRLYRPLILGWLQRFGFDSADQEDLAQDVMLTLAREVKCFEHRGRLGAFRCWLKTIAVNRAREFARRGRRRPQPHGGTAFQIMLEQLEDADSEISRQFDRQHDAHVVGQMLQAISGEFAGETIETFRQHVIEGKKAAEVAASLGVSRWSVYQSKSRVLRRLRERIGPWSDEMGLASLAVRE